MGFVWNETVILKSRSTFTPPASVDDIFHTHARVEFVLADQINTSNPAKMNANMCNNHATVQVRIHTYALHCTKTSTASAEQKYFFEYCSNRTDVLVMVIY